MMVNKLEIRELFKLIANDLEYASDLDWMDLNV